MESISQLDFQVTLKQGRKEKCCLTEQSWTLVLRSNSCCSETSANALQTASFSPSAGRWYLVQVQHPLRNS